MIHSLFILQHILFALSYGALGSVIYFISLWSIGRKRLHYSSPERIGSDGLLIFLLLFILAL